MDSSKLGFFFIFLVISATQEQGFCQVSRFKCSELISKKYLQETNETYLRRYESNLKKLNSLVYNSWRLPPDASIAKQKKSIMNLLVFFVDEFATPLESLTSRLEMVAQDLKYPALNIVDVFEKFYLSGGRFQGDPEAHAYLSQFQKIYLRIFDKPFYFRTVISDRRELLKTIPQVLRDFGQTPRDRSEARFYDVYNAKNKSLLKLVQRLDTNVNTLELPAREARPLVIGTLNYLVKEWLPYVPNFSFARVELDLSWIIPSLDQSIQTYANSISELSLQSDGELLSLLAAYSVVRYKFYPEHLGLHF